MKNNQQKKLLKSYIKYLWREIIRIVPIIRFYQIIYSDEYQNTDGGFVSINFIPDLYEANLIIYKSIYEEIPDKGITPGFRKFVARALCHEAGHCYIWELEGRKSDKERKSTEIGILIFEILEMRRII